MHSTEIEISDSRYYGNWEYESKYDGVWTCHHNGDFSGEVWILPPNFSPHEEPIKIPFVVMKELVGKYLRNREISRVEQMSGAEYIDRQEVSNV